MSEIGLGERFLETCVTPATKTAVPLMSSLKNLRQFVQLTIQGEFGWSQGDAYQRNQ